MRTLHTQENLWPTRCRTRSTMRGGGAQKKYKSRDRMRFEVFRSSSRRPSVSLLRNGSLVFDSLNLGDNLWVWLICSLVCFWNWMFFSFTTSVGSADWRANGWNMHICNLQSEETSESKQTKNARKNYVLHFLIAFEWSGSISNRSTLVEIPLISHVFIDKGFHMLLPTFVSTRCNSQYKCLVKV